MIALGEYSQRLEAAGRVERRRASDDERLVRDYAARGLEIDDVRFEVLRFGVESASGARAVLRVVDLATDEGDGRFQKIRVGLLNDITKGLADVIERGQQMGRSPRGIDPMATAGVLVSMLAHVAAHQYGFEFWGIRTADVRASMSRQVAWGVTGVVPPE